MDTDNLNLAIRKMAREESNNGNSTDSNLLGCKNYVSADFARYAISEVDGHTKMEASILHECVDQLTKVLCIPVIHDGQWTLYAFNMEDEKLSILDPLPNPMRHKDIRLKVCKALETAKGKSNMFKSKFCDFSSWKHEFVKVPQQGNSYDCGFLVFNFMRQWDGCQLDPSIRLPTDSRMIRKEFLAYVLSFKDNETHELPRRASDLIKCLTSGPAWTRCLMDNRLLNVVREGNANEFRGLDPNQGTPENVIDLVSMILRGVTSDGDGVLHIAARFGHRQLIKDIFSKLEKPPQQSNAGIASESNNRASAVRSEENSGPSAAESNNRASAVIADEGHNTNAAENDAAEVCINIELVDPVQVATFLTTRNRSGETCLHEAVRSGHKELVNSLILLDGDVRQNYRDNNELKKIAALARVVDYNGISPLYLATKLRMDDIVQVLLLDKISSPSYAGPGGRTALHAAVLLDAELTRQLRSWKPDLIGKADRSGNTPLHLIAVGGPVGIALSSDANHCNPYLVDMRKDSNGWFPIHVAAASGNLHLIKQLLKACPECMWSRSASGQSILHVAVDKKRLNVVDYVRTEQTLFQILNMTDHEGNTALHLAVKSVNGQSFCSLMKNMGVCLSISNNEGRTPLDLAAFNLEPGLKFFTDSKTLIYNHLRQAGADFGTYRWDEWTDNLAGKVDEAKLSESISKQAGLMAVCAVFILNVSVTALFSVAGKYITNTDPVAPTHAPPKHQPPPDFKMLIISDAVAFVSSALAAFCCTFAGLSSMDAMGRANLKIGGFFLCIASSAMFVMFSSSTLSAYAQVDPNIATLTNLFALVALVVLGIAFSRMSMPHAWTLLRRRILLTIILPSKKYMLEKSSVFHKHVIVILERTSGFLSYRRQPQVPVNH